MVHQLLFVTQLGTILSPEIWGKWCWLFGIWEMHESQAELVPVIGLCYWLTPLIHGGRSQLIDFGLLSTSHMCS